MDLPQHYTPLQNINNEMYFFHIIITVDTQKPRK